MGDPAGVGPELCLHALNDSERVRDCLPIVFGDAGVLTRVSEATGLPFTSRVIDRTEVSQYMRDFTEGCVVDLHAVDADQIEPGGLNAAAGRASYEYVQAAIDAALAGEVPAVTTAPINKEALRLAGLPYPGHTEIFAERCDCNRWCMMQYSEIVTCSFVTVHVGYAEVPKLLTVDRVREVIELTCEGLRRIRGREPHLIVCGLNPHAGEHGLFGDGEEERIIIPAIEMARNDGIDVTGPFPPDTAFLRSRLESTDAVVCMYHDQGHIPVKALAFDSAVNTTLGLPMIRTSVDHGTAFDIAWKNQVNTGSLFSALELAVRLARDV